MEYILFGDSDELFLAHRITQAPDFDQILPVHIDGGAFPAAALRQGIIVAIPERENLLAARLIDGDAVEGEARDAVTGLLLATGVPITAGPEIYFEEGELAFPAEFAPTPAESDAGFGER